MWLKTALVGVVAIRAPSVPVPPGVCVCVVWRVVVEVCGACILTVVAARLRGARLRLRRAPAQHRRAAAPIESDS